MFSFNGRYDSIMEDRVTNYVSVENRGSKSESYWSEELVLVCGEAGCDFIDVFHKESKSFECFSFDDFDDFNEVRMGEYEWLEPFIDRILLDTKQSQTVSYCALSDLNKREEILIDVDYEGCLSTVNFSKVNEEVLSIKMCLNTKTLSYSFRKNDLVLSPFDIPRKVYLLKSSWECFVSDSNSVKLKILKYGDLWDDVGGDDFSSWLVLGWSKTYY